MWIYSPEIWWEHWGAERDPGAFVRACPGPGEGVGQSAGGSWIAAVWDRFPYPPQLRLNKHARDTARGLLQGICPRLVKYLDKGKKPFY